MPPFSSRKDGQNLSQYWRPITHALISAPHNRYHLFSDYGGLVFGNHGQRPETSSVMEADGSSTVVDNHLSERQGGAESKS